MTSRLTGRTLAGKYLVGDLLAAGAMGSVYQAEHLGLGKPVAIKVVHEFLLADTNAAGRFQLEARAASRIQHPNVVSVLDFGSDGDVTFLVMEHVAGAPVEKELVRLGRLPPARSAEIVRQTLAGLAEAHALGVVHRDLKPSNLIVQTLRDGREHVKVIDFGIAKLTDDAFKLTALGTICGTPSYMAPEQHMGDAELDARVDVYAAGVVLFELLTGRLPFIGDALAKIALMHLTEAVPRPSSLVPDIHPVLDEIVLRAMSKSREGRFATAADMQAALDAFLRITAQPADLVDCTSCGARISRSAEQCPICGGVAVSLRAASDVISQKLGVVGEWHSLEPQRQAPPRVTPRPSGATLSPPATAAPTEEILGREAELARLAHALRREGACVRLRGTPGSGRRTLALQAARAVADGSRGLVLRIEPDAYSPPQPLGAAQRLIDALRDPARAVNEAASRRRDSAAVVLGDIDEYGRRLEPLVGGPHIVVLEHPERIDRPSLQVWQRFLDHPGRKLRVLVAEGLEPDLGPSTGEVLQLSALGGDASRRLWERYAGQSDPPPWLLSGADPLLVVLAALLHKDVALDEPESLAQLVASMLGTLPRPLTSLLSLVAVIGTRAPRPLLEVVAPKEALAVVPRALALGVLALERDELAFVHPVVGDCVLAATPAGVRSALHAAVADALPAEAAAFVRAHHARNAGQVEAAALLEEAAGDEALSEGSRTCAVEAWWRAVDLLRGADPADEVAAHARLRLSHKLARALREKGEAELGRAVLREALAALPPGMAGTAESLMELLADAMEAGDLLLAAETLERACRLGAAGAADLLRLGKELVEQLEHVGELARAGALVDQLARLPGGVEPGLTLVRARAQLARGRLAEAEREALSIGTLAHASEELRVAAYRLAASVADRRRAGSRVVDLLEKALDRAVAGDLDELSVEILDELVRACHSIGDGARADRFAQAAAMMSPRAR